MLQDQAGSTTTEIQLLLTTNDCPAVLASLREVLSSQASKLTVEVTHDLLIDDATIGDSVGSQEPLPDLIVSLRAANLETLLQPIARLAAKLAPHIKSDTSHVFGAQRHEILAGWGPVRIYYGIRRLPDMTRAAFQAYWLGHHAEVGRRLIPPYSYVQSHADAEIAAAASAASGLAATSLDGIVTVHFPDLAAAQRQLADERVATEALEDEARFIDHSRVQFGLYGCQMMER
jgi:hypothetical protein